MELLWGLLPSAVSLGLALLAGAVGWGKLSARTTAEINGLGERVNRVEAGESELRGHVAGLGEIGATLKALDGRLGRIEQLLDRNARWGSHG